MGLSEQEQKLLSDISVAEMWRHLERICEWDRLSGGPGEAAAIEYVASALHSYGLPVEMYEFQAYLSNPVSGTVEIVSDGNRPVAAKTRAFSANTPPAGVVGEIVYVPGGKDMFTDVETAERIAALDLTGKIVLSEGGGRNNMVTAQARGAVGYIHMWPSDEPYVHEGTVSPVWGSPTPEGFELLPRIPVVQVTKQDGEQLRALAEHGSCVVRLTTRTENGFRTLRLPVTEIPGETAEFVLIAGHIDSWHLGVTDNGTGNVCCLELARVFQRYRQAGGRLQRGIRIAWWPGHSNGRYAGSAWYADAFWEDLHDHCVAYLNCDSPGALGATDYSVITAVAETAAFGQQVVRELTGQQAAWERPVRAGDQSFWGPGVSSLYMLLSNRPPGQRAAVGGCGMGWWWHTEEDTLDKADRDVLLLDTKIFALSALRLATADTLPLDAAALVAELTGAVNGIVRATGGLLDLTPAVAALDELAAAVADLERADVPAAQYNAAVRHVIRTLTPVNYTSTGPFQHDPAVPQRPLPGLQPARNLPALDQAGNDFRFLHTRLIRERNRLVAAVQTATAAVQAVVRGTADRASEGLM